MMRKNKFFLNGYKNFLSSKKLKLKMSEDKDNGISIITKNNEEEYPYISISRPSCYRRHKARVFLIRNQGSALFADGDTPNVIITFNFWREHGLIIVDPDRPTYLS